MKSRSRGEEAKLKSALFTEKVVVSKRKCKIRHDVYRGQRSNSCGFSSRDLRGNPLRVRSTTRITLTAPTEKMVNSVLICKRKNPRQKIAAL